MIRALFLAAAVACSSTAFAQDHATDSAPSEAMFGVVQCADGTSAPQERDDQRLVENAMRAFQQASFPALQAYLPQLQAAMDHAPACYPETERRGDRYILRMPEDEQPAALSLRPQTGGS